MRAVFALPALRNELLEKPSPWPTTARGLGTEDRACMPEVDWAAWDTLTLDAGRLAPGLAGQASNIRAGYPPPAARFHATWPERPRPTPRRTTNGPAVIRRCSRQRLQSVLKGVEVAQTEFSVIGEQIRAASSSRIPRPPCGPSPPDRRRGCVRHFLRRPSSFSSAASLSRRRSSRGP